MPEQTKTKSQIQISTEDIIKKAQSVMTPEEFAQHGLIIRRFERAKQLKQANYKYFDGMCYDDDYATNEDLKNTFLTPKANATEVRVNTGTAEKKLDAVKNELLSMNLETEVRAHDQDDLEISDLGDDMNNMQKRTCEIEKDDDVWEEIIDEALSQRVIYVRENFVEKHIKRGKVKISMAQKEILSGLKVFPGSWTIPAYRWDEQPYIVLYDRKSYEEAKAILSKYPRFKDVLPNKSQRELYLGGAFDYQFGELQDGEVEIVIYESLPDNEYQIYANGIPLLAPGSPLPWEYDQYDVRAYITKPMSRDFLAGRSLASMAKTMQALSSETIRLLLRKFQQALEPPMATSKSGKIYARGIWDPGSITQGLRKADIEKLIDHDGVTQGEYQMYKLIEEKTEEFIGTPNIAQGMQGSREMSATEVLTVQKQFIKQLGYTIAALMRMKRDLTEIRIYTILENYLEPSKRVFDEFSKEVKEVYRSFTIHNSRFSDNRIGKKIIRFIDRDITPEEGEMIGDKERESAINGEPVKLRFINRKKLKSFPILWYVNVFVSDKEGTALDKVMFAEQLNQAAGVLKLTGKTLNPDVVTDSYERKFKARHWFQKSAPGTEGMTPGGMNPEVDKNRAEGQKLMEQISAMGGNQNSLGNQMGRGLEGGARSAAQSTLGQEAITE